jgi:uncharacterized membrane protein
MVYRQKNRDFDRIVAEPDRSADWATNKLVLIVMCALSGTIALGFTLLGAWPILPFAGLEMMALGSALYYVCWKQNYRHVITLEPEVVRVQKGHYFPKEEWEIPRDDAALSIVPEAHPWEAPSITLASKGEQISLGEFLNREDALVLMALLKGRVRVGSHSPRSEHDF